MKFFAFLAVPFTGYAASWSSLFTRSALLEGQRTVSQEDVANCTKQTSKYITKPMTKEFAIEKAMDHCALDKKVDDKNFVCPHFKQVLANAFARESTFKEFTAEDFCDVSETYVYNLKYGAANIPNVAGSGSGKKFKVSKECKPIVAKTLQPETSLPSTVVPDFWFSLCMNQNCAHFLPSRTRWCTEDHQPLHSAAVCEAIRTYARDEVIVVGDKKMKAKEICSIYDEFVEDSHINVEAYMHVMHRTKKHPVPSPENRKRALDSARMKHEAGAHQIRDNSGDPVKSSAVASGSKFLALIGIATLLHCS
jgi:hypothetical protein